VSLPESSIRRPSRRWLLTAGVTLAGRRPFVSCPWRRCRRWIPDDLGAGAASGRQSEVMAATVSDPLERALGRIAGVTEITSS